MFLVKGVLKICSKFTGENPCQSVISMKLLCNFIEITLRHGCSPVKFSEHLFIRTPLGAASERNSRELTFYCFMATFPDCRLYDACEKESYHKQGISRHL